MGKIQKILLGVFLGGVLLGGIGTGVAFVEYASITYAGERILESEELVTDNMDFPVDKEKGIVEVASVRYGEGLDYQLEYDSTVPENIVRFQVTYNAQTVSPYIEFAVHDQEEMTSPAQGMIYLTWRNKNEFAVWMKNKDMILEDLKQKRIATYDVTTITRVKILVNPAMKDYIHMI